MKTESVSTLLFFPEKPDRETVIFKILEKLQIRVSENFHEKYSAVINWEDTTIRKNHSKLEEIAKTISIINLGCFDISKKNVDKCFKEIFGFALNIDPLNFTGDCLRKSNLNAVKDGQVIKAPAILEDNYVYQYLINNKSSESEYEDIRVPIFGEIIPLVFLKYRTVIKRFSDDFDRTIIAKPKHVFSALEITQILKFCRKIGLDYGELDVLRDRDSGKIYIIDANNTPWGPPEELNAEDMAITLEIFAKAFQDEFLIGNFITSNIS